MYNKVVAYLFYHENALIFLNVESKKAYKGFSANICAGVGFPHNFTSKLPQYALHIHKNEIRHKFRFSLALS